MVASKNKMDYNNQYTKEHYTRLSLLAYPDMAEKIKAAAAAAGQTTSAYILQAVQDRMDKDKR